MTTPTILFEFAGRRGNLELQLPLLRRIREQHPHVEVHLWNLAKEASDDRYLRELDEPDIEVHHQLAGPRPFQRWSRVWRHYASNRFKEHLFIKLDDDVVFLQTDRFGHFLNALADAPGEVVSALTINNGASAPLLPEFWRHFTALDIPLLDVHLHNSFAALAHDYFFENWRKVLDTSVEEVPTEDWLSINCIGLDWSTLRRIAYRLGTPSPPLIAGRRWSRGNRLGDEGAVNLESRRILRGFTAAHLSFGPQDLTAQQLSSWRSRYADIGAQHLLGVPIGTPQ